MAKAITPKALDALAQKALAEDTVRYGRDADAYPHTKGTPYIIAEAFGITPREAREHSKAFMAAWRAAGGTAQVKRLTAQANGTWTGEEEAAPAPAKAQTVQIDPTPTVAIENADVPEYAMELARAIVSAGGGRKTEKQVAMVARGIIAMNAAVDATA